VANDWRNKNSPPPRIPHPQSVEGRNFNWASVGAPHPDSVEGRSFDWSKLGVPHPNSTAGKQGNWRAELGRSVLDDAEELAAAIEEVEKFLREEADQLRKAIEDQTTEDLYVDKLGPLEATERYLTAEGRFGADLGGMARQLRIALGWFNRELVREAKVEQKLTAGVDTAYRLRLADPVRKKTKLLGEMRAAFGDVFDVVLRDVEKQKEQAKRAGQFVVLCERWRTEMRLHPAYKPNAWGYREAEILPVPPSYSQTGKRGNREPAEPKAPEKTWVEFRLVDQDGKPVGNVGYQVTLPDGEVFRGRLNAQGMVRFDRIDPGECQISFPEIDGGEWKAA
jgi:hypothetical protein